MKDSRIVFGGGWKSAEQSRLRVKAWTSLFLAIGVAAIASHLDESAFADWMLKSSGGILAVTISLFLFERPRSVGWYREPVQRDLGKLYSHGASDPIAPEPSPRSSADSSRVQKE